MIPLSKPHIGRREARAVWKVLRSKQLCFGPSLKKFEEMCADIAGTTYACAVNSGTSGLHLIIKSLGIGQNDAVFAPSFTFIASTNCALFEGAHPILIDIESVTHNIDPKKILTYIDTHCKFTDGKLIDTATGKHIKAIVGVHIFGHPCDVDTLQNICTTYNLYFIEDAAEAIGSTYKGRKCGGLGIASIFAFYPNKQITTGEGGVITTNDKDIYDLVQSMKNQGRGTNMQWLTHDKLGYNFRLSDINAAIGVVQLKKLGTIMSKRNTIASWYNEALKQHQDILSVPQKLDTCTYLSRFVYVVNIKKNIDIQDVITHLYDKGIQSKNYFSPVHLQSFYKETLYYGVGDLPVTEAISSGSLSLPFYTGMTKKQVSRVVDVLVNYLYTN